MGRRTWTALLASLGLAGCAGPAPALSRPCALPPADELARREALPLSRAEFTQRLATIRPGATARTVVERLGRPDDVITELDPGGVRRLDAAEVWRWGTDGHLTFGTLGTVLVGRGGGVVEVVGGEGLPPAGLAEDELRRLLRLVAALRGVADHDPLRLIQAVNGLWPLGRERALAVISEFLRVTAWWTDERAREGVFLLAQVLFDPPEGERLPRCELGAPFPSEPDEGRSPRFPVVLVDDVPVAVASGYMLFGEPPSPEAHLEWFRLHGRLRAAPLAPTPTPVEALERLAMADGPRLLPELDRSDLPWLWSWQYHVLAQARRLVSTVTREDPTPPTAPGRFTRFDLEACWGRLRTSCGEPLVWDGATSAYTRADGSRLAPEGRRLRPRALWRPAIARGEVTLVLERVDESTVRGELRIEPSGAIGDARLELLLADGTTLHSLPVTSSASAVAGDWSMTMSSFELELPLGQGVRATLEVDGALDPRSDLLVP